MSAVKKIIAVVGAAGNQGRGVVRALLANGGDAVYSVRALTRDTASTSSVSLKEAYPSIDLVAWDPSSSTSIQNAFRGAYGVFCMTVPFSLPCSTEEQLSTEEIVLAKRIADAAQAVGVKHFLFSSLPSIAKASNGKFTKVYHFDNKAVVDAHLASIPLPSTSLIPGLFASNYNRPSFAKRGTLSTGESGVIFSTPAPPEAKMGYLDPNYDMGVFARAVLDHGPPAAGFEVYPVNSANISYADVAATFTRVTGVPAEYQQGSAEVFRAGAEKGYKQSPGSILGLDMMQMVQWYAEAPADKTCYGTMDDAERVKAEKELGVKASSWEEYLKRTGWQGP